MLRLRNPINLLIFVMLHDQDKGHNPLIIFSSLVWLSMTVCPHLFFGNWSRRCKLSKPGELDISRVLQAFLRGVLTNGARGVRVLEAKLLKGSEGCYNFPFLRNLWSEIRWNRIFSRYGFCKWLTCTWRENWSSPPDPPGVWPFDDDVHLRSCCVLLAFALRVIALIFRDFSVVLQSCSMLIKLNYEIR